jgi:hypothetical protein
MEQETLNQPPEYDATAEAQAMWDRAQAFLPKEGETAKVEEKAAPTDPEPVKEEVKQDAPIEKTEEVAGSQADDQDEPPKGKKEAGAAWKDLRSQLKQLREERDNLKSTLPEKDKTVQEKMLEIEQMKAKIAEFEGKDISGYEKKISEMESKLGEHEKFRSIHDVQNSSAYQEAILEPAAAIGQALDVLAGANDVDTKTLQDVLEISDPIEQRKKLREVTEGWHPTDAAELMEHARNTQALLKKSSEMLENADKAKQELSFMEQEKARKAKEDEEKQFTSATEAANKLIQEKIPFLKDNKGLLEAVQKAEIKKDPASMAVAARASVILPHLLRQLDERNAKIAELETSLKSRIAASPRPASTSTPVSTRDDLPTGYDQEAMMARFHAMTRQGS